MVTDKVELLPQEQEAYIAEDGSGRSFRYGEDDLSSVPADMSAEEWFGNPPLQHDDLGD